MRSSIAVDVDAPARLVFELARNVERWPVLLPHYRDVRVLERHADGSTTARMLAVRNLISELGYGIPVTWRARVWVDGSALGLRFRHLGGATDGMDVNWQIEPNARGCRVTIDHRFDPPVPGWAPFVDRLFVRPIAGRTLATFRAIAEAADAAAGAVRSENASGAKKST